MRLCYERLVGELCSPWSRQRHIMPMEIMLTERGREGLKHFRNVIVRRFRWLRLAELGRDDSETEACDRGRQAGGDFGFRGVIEAETKGSKQARGVGAEGLSCAPCKKWRSLTRHHRTPGADLSQKIQDFHSRR